MMKFPVALVLLLLMFNPAAAKTLTLLAFGDSLTAGYGLQPSDAFPVKLEAALKARGHDVRVINAGVAGDTALDGASRVDWALSDDVDAVIVEFGANDALRGLPVPQAEQALDQLLAKLGERKLPVLLAGMRAPPNLGPDYQAAFDGMYPRLAEKHGSLLYPFFLDGVAAEVTLNQADGMHPNPAGVDVIVERILPSVETLLEQAAARQAAEN
jgi:acyl-CoA thioesterase-1